MIRQVQTSSPPGEVREAATIEILWYLIHFLWLRDFRASREENRAYADRQAHTS